MKNAILLLLLLCFLFGCKRDNALRLKIQDAEELIMSGNPDSAFVLLKSVTNPDVLDNKTFAHWCFIYAEACEQLNEDMPFVPQMERVTEYYEKHGTLKERIKCLMYLGQAYEDEMSFDEAMQAYLQAVDLAKSEQEYLLTGEIYNKIVWLHDFGNNYDEAGSTPTYLALADLYTLKKEYEKARYHIKMVISGRTSNYLNAMYHDRNDTLHFSCFKFVLQKVVQC